MIDDVRRNPGLLKLDLFCKGMKIDESCTVSEDAREILRTRAGLGSGLEVILPDGLYANVPVLEKFVDKSPYVLHKENGRYMIKRDGEYICDITLPKEPKFYKMRTSSGKLMSRIGVLQGTYLGIFPTDVCDYWKMEPKMNCKFCSVGLNLGEYEDREKTIQDVVETVKAARKELGITYVHFNTGHYEGDTYLDQLEPIIKRVKKETGLLIGVQTPPHHDLTRYHYLKKIGVNQVSFCFELWDEERFKEVCPGKNKFYGLKRYLDAVEYCAKIFDTTNGEIIAGLEPPENSIEAIDWMTSVGAIPTVCIFRPLTGTDYENVPPPKTEEMIPIFRRMYEACMEHNLPIDVAPNIKVSIVLLPEEGRYFLDDPEKYKWRELKWKILRQFYHAYFYTKIWFKR